MILKPRNILIRGVNWIGDAVLTLPAIRSVRRAFPDARISLLVRPWVSDLFMNNPAIDEIIPYEEYYRTWSGKFWLARILKQKKFDSAILFQNAFDAAFVTWLSGIPRRLGYGTDGRRLLLTGSVPVTGDVRKKHQVYYYLHLIEQMGIDPVEPIPYLYLSESERQEGRDRLGSLFPDVPGPVVGLNPGATYGSAKRWLPDRFARLAERIVHELDGAVMIFGSAAETAIAQEITSLLEGDDSASRVVDLSGKTSLRELSGLMSLCDALITNDSGPMHIAAALFVPIVALFGSTNEETTGPFGQGHRVISRRLPCSPCMKRECPEGHLRCMTEITADEVFDALKDVLPQGKAVFLDRDGTVIEDKNYLNSFEELRILPGVKEDLLKLRKAGYKLLGITNQSGIARKLVDEEFLIKSNVYLEDTLGIEDFYYCPHHPDERCPCRKPEPLLALMAAIKHRVNLKESCVIGDKESDVLLAKNAGATGILLSSEGVPDRTCADHVARSLHDAVRWILDREKTPRPSL